MSREDSQKELLKKTKKSYNHYLVDYVTRVVCEYYKEPHLYFLENVGKRGRKYTEMRKIIFFTIRNNCEMSLDEIGSFFGKDYTTVIHSIKTLTGLMEWDKKLAKEVSDIQSLIDLRSKAKVSNLDLEGDFYFIDMNKMDSLKINDKKAILLVGFSEEEISRMINNLPAGTERMSHDKTGMYILEEKKSKTS